MREVEKKKSSGKEIAIQRPSHEAEQARVAAILVMRSASRSKSEEQVAQHQPLRQMRVSTSDTGTGGGGESREVSC